jgi:hypothetical protein
MEVEQSDFFCPLPQPMLIVDVPTDTERGGLTHKIFFGLALCSFRLLISLEDRLTRRLIEKLDKVY